MRMNEYQDLAGSTNKGTALYKLCIGGEPTAGMQQVTGMYNAMGLAGECGEVAEKIKKYARDGAFFPDLRDAIQKELGDVLWYLSQLAADFGLSLEQVASANLEKLASRAQRGVLSGSGDNR